MIRLLYTSEGRADTMARDLDAIVAVSRRNNPELGTTGLLTFHGTTFIQLLEGLEETMRLLLDTIRTDRRHSDLRILSQERTRSPRLTDWAMARHDADTRDGRIAAALTGCKPAPMPTPSFICATR